MMINTGMIKFVIRKINHSAIEIPPIYYIKKYNFYEDVFSFDENSITDFRGNFHA